MQNFVPQFCSDTRMHPLTPTHHTHTAVELNYGTVYCFKCKDYVYDAALDEISHSLEQQLAHKKYHVSRQPVMYVAWEPTKDEIDLLKQNPKRRKVEPGSTIGTIIMLILNTTFHYEMFYVQIVIINFHLDRSRLIVGSAFQSLYIDAFLLHTQTQASEDCITLATHAL